MKPDGIITDLDPFMGLRVCIPAVQAGIGEILLRGFDPELKTAIVAHGALMPGECNQFCHFGNLPYFLRFEFPGLGLAVLRPVQNSLLPHAVSPIF